MNKRKAKSGRLFLVLLLIPTGNTFLPVPSSSFAPSSCIATYQEPGETQRSIGESLKTLQENFTHRPTSSPFYPVGHSIIGNTFFLQRIFWPSYRAKLLPLKRGITAAITQYIQHKKAHGDREVVILASGGQTEDVKWILQVLNRYKKLHVFLVVININKESLAKAAAAVRKYKGRLTLEAFYLDADMIDNDDISLLETNVAELFGKNRRFVDLVIHSLGGATYTVENRDYFLFLSKMSRRGGLFLFDAETYGAERVGEVIRSTGFSDVADEKLRGYLFVNNRLYEGSLSSLQSA